MPKKNEKSKMHATMMVIRKMKSKNACHDDGHKKKEKQNACHDDGHKKNVKQNACHDDGHKKNAKQKCHGGW
jgi:hypothetical protein